MLIFTVKQTQAEVERRISEALGETVCLSESTFRRWRKATGMTSAPYDLNMIDAFAYFGGLVKRGATYKTACALTIEFLQGIRQ